jgi:hypothetical protein
MPQSSVTAAGGALRPGAAATQAETGTETAAGGRPPKLVSVLMLCIPQEAPGIGVSIVWIGRVFCISFGQALKLVHVMQSCLRMWTPVLRRQRS